METRLRLCCRCLLCGFAGLALAASARADGPAFDRPGIAFSPSTLPAHAFAWEQGLPDFQQDRSDGVTQRAYAASTRLRYGIADRWEVQLAAPLFEEIDTIGSGRGFHLGRRRRSRRRIEILADKSATVPLPRRCSAPSRSDGRARTRQ